MIWPNLSNRFEIYNDSKSATFPISQSINQSMSQSNLIYIAPLCHKRNGEKDTYQSISNFDRTYFSVFRPFVGMEPLEAFRLLAEPHVVTKGFVLVQMDRNIIFLY